MHRVPETRAASKKSRFAALTEMVIGLQKQVLELRQEIRPMIEREVERNLGDKIAMIDGALTESILQKEVLIEKGLMTREDINGKYAELKAKREAR